LEAEEAAEASGTATPNGDKKADQVEAVTSELDGASLEDKNE